MSAAFSWEALDRDDALAEARERAEGVSRGRFLAGIASLGGGALLGLAGRAEAAGRQDRAILNYALTLEYLQAAFYTEAERGRALTGPAARAARTVGAVERAHVKAFRDLLGRNAIKRPTFDFQGTTEAQRDFLKTAVAFEDLSVAAYKGQAPRIRDKRVLTAALGIHSVEARHAAWMRYLVGAQPASDAFDRARSRPEVLRLVRSTRFISSSPRTTSRGSGPRFTG
jgi:hypothetical protein